MGMNCAGIVNVAAERESAKLKCSLTLESRLRRRLSHFCRVECKFQSFDAAEIRQMLPVHSTTEYMAAYSNLNFHECQRGRGQESWTSFVKPGHNLS